MVLVTAYLVDSKNRLVAVGDDGLTFRVIGGGGPLVLEIGDASTHEIDGADKRHAFNGL